MRVTGIACETCNAGYPLGIIRIGEIWQNILQMRVYMGNMEIKGYVILKGILTDFI